MESILPINRDSSGQQIQQFIDAVIAKLKPVAVSGIFVHGMDLSYSESYFGEEEGKLKSAINEANHSFNSISHKLGQVVVEDSDAFDMVIEALGHCDFIAQCLNDSLQIVLGNYADENGMASETKEAIKQRLQMYFDANDKCEELVESAGKSRPLIDALKEICTLRANMKVENATPSTESADEEEEETSESEDHIVPENADEAKQAIPSEEEGAEEIPEEEIEEQPGSGSEEGPLDDDVFGRMEKLIEDEEEVKPEQKETQGDDDSEEEKEEDDSEEESDDDEEEEKESLEMGDEEPGLLSRVWDVVTDPDYHKKAEKSVRPQASNEDVDVSDSLYGSICNASDNVEDDLTPTPVVGKQSLMDEIENDPGDHEFRGDFVSPSQEGLKDAVKKIIGLFTNDSSKDKKPGEKLAGEKSSQRDQEAAIDEAINVIKKYYTSDKWLSNQSFVDGNVAASSFSEMFVLDGKFDGDVVATVAKGIDEARQFVGKSVQLIGRHEGRIQAIDHELRKAVESADDKKEIVGLVDDAIKEISKEIEAINKGLPKFRGSSLGGWIPEKSYAYRSVKRDKVDAPKELPALDQAGVKSVAGLLGSILQGKTTIPEVPSHNWTDHSDGSAFNEKLHNVSIEAFERYYDACSYDEMGDRFEVPLGVFRDEVIWGVCSALEKYINASIK